MIGVLSQLLGGIGIFLLGMILMTEGLREAAGAALRDILARFTGGRLPSIASGAAVTALVQSSSATTLTTIGFVSAGFLTFPQALGVIVGANLGTTSTGWIVSLLGLKLQISVLALPLVGIGALARLLARGRIGMLGMALAGFGLIFVGIDVLQGSMEGVAERLDPSRFPGDTLAGRILLVGLGAVMTVVMQSSSAAVATTLTALHSGAIGLEQAATLVIGQNVGTTVTAALAGIGASVAARRTALAHILFNVFAGLLAFLALPLFMIPISWLGEGPAAGDPAILIAAFHTLFNVAAALILFPVLGGFSQLVMRIVPEEDGGGVRYLDDTVKAVPPVAMAVAHRAVSETADRSFRRLVHVLDGGETGARGPAHGLDDIGKVRRFLADVRTSPDSPGDYRKHLHLLHAMDHLERLELVLPEGADRIRKGRGLVRFEELARPLVQALEGVLPLSRLEEGEAPGGAVRATGTELGVVAEGLAELRRKRRSGVLEETAAGIMHPDAAKGEIEALRWLDRAAYHAWRIHHHLRMPSGVPDVDPPGLEVFEEA